MTELKPCPFCGNKHCAIIENDSTGFSGWCNECETEGPYKHTKIKALEAWNKRTPLGE